MIRFAPFAAVFFLAIGCAEAPVGDPCVPENVEGEGVPAGLVDFEASSVQCRTRVCMAYNVDGTSSFDPRMTFEECEETMGGAMNCGNFLNEAEYEQRVYCTCRCSAPPGSDATLCECPDGFSCVDELVGGGGGAGLQGGYCVRSEIAARTR